ncbi:MAG: TlpA family protein disulfide reductase [Methylohalobius sp. ZOD2]
MIEPFSALNKQTGQTLRAGRISPFSRALLIGLLTWLSYWISPAVAQTSYPWTIPDTHGNPRVQLWFFWSSHCPHCLEARPHVVKMAKENSWLILHDMNLTGHPEHMRRYMAMAAALDRKAQSVPAFIFCGEMHAGWGRPETTGAMLLERLTHCRQRALAGRPDAATTEAENHLDLPWIGEVDAGTLSLPVLTLVIAGLDAFNPCAFFVLLFLLSLLVHLRDRRRMLLIGGLFVLISGVMYFAFMAAWLTLFRIMGGLPWVTAAAGVLAVFIGSVNVKDFFAFQQGLSLSIPESRKADIFRRGREVLSAGNLPAMLGATVILAVAANFYELLCTAGFPMVYTRLLTLQVENGVEHFFWLVFYNLIYILPLLLIVLVFVHTMGTRKLSEREGRLLKLFSGLMMLGLGLLLLAAPERLDNLAVAFGILGGAALITALAAQFQRSTS